MQSNGSIKSVLIPTPRFSILNSGGLLGTIQSPINYAVATFALVVFAIVLLAVGVACMSDPAGETHPFGTAGLYVAIPLLVFGGLFLILTAIYARNFYSKRQVS